MPLILGTNSIKDTGYEVANSCMFDSASSQNLTRTDSGGSSRRIFTYSVWVKRVKLSKTNADMIVNNASNESNQFKIELEGSSSGDDHDIRIRQLAGGTQNINIKTSAEFRDVSAWYHIVVAVDTTQSTESDRIKLYVNGNQITAFDSATYPPINNDTEVNVSSSYTTHIGKRNNNDHHFDGYMCEFVFIDGSQLAPTSFGEFDEDTNIWKPKDVSGLTFGNNGFYLDFEDSSNLGNDKSGNNSDFTANNLSATNQSEDTCTNNYAIMNSALPPHSSDFRNGNVEWRTTTASHYYWANSTVGLSSGKWYVEAKLQTAAAHNYFGISVDAPDNSAVFLAGGGGAGGTNDQYEWAWKSSDGKIYNNTDGGTAYGSTYTTGDILGMYLDLDNNKLYFAKNGTIQNSGTGISITDPANLPNDVYFIAVGDGTSSNSVIWEVNFGNPSYGISSANTDPEGYGTFEYSPNDGGSASFDSSAKDFFAINTKNLAEYG